MVNVPYPPKVGRPNAFSKEDHANIIEVAKHTLVLNNIAGKVGRDRKTIINWLERAEKEHKEGLETEFAQFFLDFKNAVSDFIMTLETRLLHGDEQRWQRLAWYLERTARDDYGQDSWIIQEIQKNIEALKAANEGAKNG